MPVGAPCCPGGLRVCCICRGPRLAAAPLTCPPSHGRAPQVEWLKERVGKIPVRLVFESSLELMESTQVGGFQMAPGGKSKGPPPAVKKVRRDGQRVAGRRHPAAPAAGRRCSMCVGRRPSGRGGVLPVAAAAGGGTACPAFLRLSRCCHLPSPTCTAPHPNRPHPTSPRC